MEIEGLDKREESRREKGNGKSRRRIMQTKTLEKEQ